MISSEMLNDNECDVKVTGDQRVIIFEVVELLMVLAIEKNLNLKSLAMTAEMRLLFDEIHKKENK